MPIGLLSVFLPFSSVPFSFAQEKRGRPAGLKPKTDDVRRSDEASENSAELRRAYTLYKTIDSEYANYGPNDVV